MNDGYERHKRYAFYALVTVALLCAGYFLLFKLLLPVVVAWMIASLLQPPIRSLSRFTGFRKKWVAVILYLLILIALGAVSVLICNRLYREIRELLNFLADNGDGLIAEARKYVQNILGKFDFIRQTEEITSVITELLTSSVSKLYGKLTELLGGMVTSLPAILFAVLIFLMAGFYLTVDFDSVERSVGGLLPSKAVRVVGNLRGKLAKTVSGYIRAYLILLSITFAELLISFSILKIRYALILSALISILDILPAIGVGTVLLPWAAVCFLIGNPGQGIGLLIVFAVVSLLRQLIEPHIVGSQIGLSPLMSLLSVYLGYRLGGVVGILLAPIAAILVREILLLSRKSGETDAENG